MTSRPILFTLPLKFAAGPMPKATAQFHQTSPIGDPIGNQHLQTLTLPISPELLISLATGPMLLGLLSAKSLSQFVQQIGLASEEMFRGDRLPLLKMPISEIDNNNDSLQLD